MAYAYLRQMLLNNSQRLFKLEQEFLGQDQSGVKNILRDLNSGNSKIRVEAINTMCVLSQDPQ